MSERCERTSVRRSEWPSTLRVDFILILPTVRGSDAPADERALLLAFLNTHLKLIGLHELNWICVVKGEGE